MSERWGVSRGEEALLGNNHAQVGAFLLAEWGLPEAVTGAVRFHHNPDLSQTTALAFLLLLADLCAHGLGESFGWSALSPASINENLDSIGVEWNQIEGALDRVKQRLGDKL
jgi:HD-like signal output (HDOD) protein